MYDNLHTTHSQHNLLTHKSRTQLTHNSLTTQLTYTQLTHTQLTHTQLVHTQHSAWQVWHLGTSICTLCGRRGTCGTGLAPVARLVPVCRRGRRGCSCGRRGIWKHLAASCNHLLSLEWPQVTASYACYFGNMGLPKFGLGGLNPKFPKLGKPSFG